MFTADQARNLPSISVHQYELELNERVLQGAAAITDPSTLAHQRKIGVLIYASDAARMEADMHARGFRITRDIQPGFLRAHW